LAFSIRSLDASINRFKIRKARPGSLPTPTVAAAAGRAAVALMGDRVRVKDSPVVSEVGFALTVAVSGSIVRLFCSAPGAVFGSMLEQLRPKLGRRRAVSRRPGRASGRNPPSERPDSSTDRDHQRVPHE
jgi:hypothetical protein